MAEWSKVLDQRSGGPWFKSFVHTWIFSQQPKFNSSTALCKLTRLVTLPLQSRYLRFVVLSCFFFLSIFFRFSIIQCTFVIHLFHQLLFGYVTFHIFVYIFSSVVSIVWYSFFYYQFSSCRCHYVLVVVVATQIL